ncbi:MAG: Fic family protein [Alphaproteobacteria bacterium]|nr:Fic family protein [Alphaproteobacteria bacterium]MDA8003569.1 Fic family protein [Alphaproteobacteria bacterium]MDA8004949.1 Fic family protein [Alphaproteobacteria bacterium]MDA8012331.1 Fic family protein [Alphaproteobacteria bacterium]
MAKPVKYHRGKFPPKNLDWERLAPRTSGAMRAISAYEEGLRSIPNPAVLLNPMTRLEAIASNKIEGTQTTLEEVLLFEAQTGNVREEYPFVANMHEVINYIFALGRASSSLEKRPLSHNLIKRTHKIMLSGVRGRGKSPGEYRATQNYIGDPGSDIASARFIPCAPDDLQQAMDVWESFMNEQSYPDPLVQLALVHAEFEAIHPFHDGNGRLGRLLIPLFLYDKKMDGGRILSQPYFYISEYLEEHRDEYMDGLLRVSRDGDWTGWCEFFLDALKVQANRDCQKIHAIVSLYEDRKKSILRAVKSPFGVYALDFIFKKPMFTTPGLMQDIGCSRITANKLVKVMCEEGFVKERVPASGNRASIFVFHELSETVKKEMK